MRTSAKESFEASQSSRQAETTSTRPTVIDVTRQRWHRQDHDGGSSLWRRKTTNDWKTWSSGAGAEINTPHWERTDGRQPSCNHPSEATSQITSDCKTKNYIQRSAVAHRERRPQASEKRRTSLPSLDISKVSPKHFKFHIFFFPVCGGSGTGGAKGIGQDTYLYTLDELIQSKTTGHTRGTTRDWCGKETR